MDWNQFRQKHGKNENVYFKWRQLLSAIPREWKEKVNNDVQTVTETNFEPHLQVITRILYLERLTSKEMYNILINKLWENPTSELGKNLYNGKSDNSG